MSNLLNDFAQASFHGRRYGKSL